jgi:DNA-binding transcriptional ArsR family regulator
MDIFTALADPTRRQVLDLLRRSERAAGELGEAFPRLSQPAVSRHLRVLREAGLVRVRQEQQRRVYALEPRGLEQLDRWLSHYRHFWTEQLDALEKHLDARARERGRGRKKGSNP